MYSTACRRAVLEVLLGATTALTQDEIADRLGEGSCNRVSIYRTLGTLVEADLVHRAYLDERAQHFELADNCGERQCHPHFTCTQCGSTECLTGVDVPMVENPRGGYVITRQQVRLEGVCPGCGEDGRTRDD